MKVVHELEPIYDRESKILILGSMPSVMSRKLGFYYMHPSNRFWKVLSGVFEDDVTDKKAFLKRHHIALWDVISECLIENSSDSSIKEVKVNDLEVILKVAKIEKIVTTGSKADSLYQKYIYPKILIKNIALPSTSSANARMSLDDLIEEYKVIKE